jgi:hypothetical protein
LFGSKEEVKIESLAKISNKKWYFLVDNY